jgi:hypothetical protein
MFWRLCVTNEDKASNLCFKTIKSEKLKSTNKLLPVAELYDAITGADEQIAIPLVSPREMKELICTDKPSHLWRTYNERFPDEPSPQSVMSRLWWNSGTSTLIWLQRAYLLSRFPDFDPASGRDDDTPYDADHMVPAADWARHWTLFSNDLVLPGLTRDQREATRDPRVLLGDSIGNLRLIDFSVNRAEQDDPYIIKLEKEIVAEAERPTVEMSREEIDYHSSMCFDPGAINIWRTASGSDGDEHVPAKHRVWPNERLSAFQQAVEARTAWLYDKFYSELGFASWKERVIPHTAD